MNIKILGAGCAKCRQLEKNVRTALVNLNIDAEVEKVTDINKIMEYEVMMTPALVVEGAVKSTGKIWTVYELERLFGKE
ncbi:MAG: TM0996/MTH895 family glutaredoxin-like protein [Candidatus Cloacimonetes bacterium]|nr:TM0996/MTH895 family glutaredoxin-like protein [Candidatus Cloacimonadota bacterium]